MDVGVGPVIKLAHVELRHFRNRHTLVQFAIQGDDYIDSCKLVSNSSSY